MTAPAGILVTAAVLVLAVTGIWLWARRQSQRPGIGGLLEALLYWRANRAVALARGFTAYRHAHASWLRLTNLRAQAGRENEHDIS